jgi:HEAT repeat protein
MRALVGQRCAAALAALACSLALSACRDAPTAPVATPASVALDPAIGKLLAKLRDADEREAALAALVAIGEPAIPALSAALRDSDPDVRFAAVETLESIKTAAVVDPLLSSLQDGEDVIRLRGVEALGTVGDRRAVEPLLQRYASDDDDQVRYEILTSLGKIGDPRARELLLAELKSSDRYVRMWAMDALCTMRDQRAAELAVSLLQDSEAFVRQQVLRACDAILDSAAGHAALIQVATGDADFDATVEARRQLRDAVQKAGADATLREQIRGAAQAGLGGPQPAFAAFLLADVGDPAGAAALRDALANPNVFVRHHAAYALGQVGGADNVPPLIAALGDAQPLVTATAYDSLSLYAQRGDARAKAAVDGYRGQKFDRPMPR